MQKIRLTTSNYFFFYNLFYSFPRKELNIRVNWFSSSWWDVVKVQVLDTSTGIQSINEPMIEDKDCYNKLMQKMESWISED